MSRLTVFSSPFLLGFDEIERHLERVARAAGDGYPPYNIERLPQDRSGERLRIVLAVAGFARADLDVTLNGNELIIEGRQTAAPAGDFLHRGIAARQFRRAFILADGMEVKEALIEKGLLTVELVRPEPQPVVRKIEILAR